MGLKEKLAKIPEHIKKEPEFKFLNERIHEKGIGEGEELIGYLEKEIALVEKWLAENKRRGGTMVKELRDKAVHLGVLKKGRKLAEDFLA